MTAHLYVPMMYNIVAAVVVTIVVVVVVVVVRSMLDGKNKKLEVQVAMRKID